MHSLRLVSLTGLVALTHGNQLSGGKHRFAARQDNDYGYAYGLAWPKFLVPTGKYVDRPSMYSSDLSIGTSSGTIAGTISASGTTSVPYGNSTASLSATAYSTGSVYTSRDPNMTSLTVSGTPSPSSNATVTSNFITGTSYGTVSGSPLSTSNITDPRKSYSKHGPYPFPTSKKAFLPSGSGVSQTIASATNATSPTATDPSASRVYPTRGPYTRRSSLKPYSILRVLS